ncbi:MAG: class I tRNA ligase family protein [Eggerthellaceae bacterium]|nr:class I tRNA ligase family protein [Eggerthellaceae bacterium]
MGETSYLKREGRPIWPARAVVTAGMPYGNKALHFGHIGGVFVPADAFARFLRDRIGAENVRFVSGTDCFGSPIDEGYHKLVEAGQFSGTIREYVQRNHDAQAATLAAYDVAPDIFEGSGIGHAGEVHAENTLTLIRTLYENGWLKRLSTLQFFDPEAGIFLNGRQVQGHCPVQGCKSEKAYADECDLGHQFAPEDLLGPKSNVTGCVPELRPVENWYFDLPAFTEFLRGEVAKAEADPEIRAIVLQTISEFLVPPIIYVKVELEDAYRAVAGELPAHTFRPAEGGKQSFELEFATIENRDAAKAILGKAGVRYRTGKALVPFRITGNIAWGVPAPELEGVEGLTVWCWPESLWAPVSFTMACNDLKGLPRDSWQDFWCSDDAEIYQFIGQDNLYFYGVAQPAMWEAMNPQGLRRGDGPAKPLKQSRLIANYHVLFGKVKASSSGAVKPPSADELLNHYTAEQLRAHFLSLGLSQKSVGFCPKVFEADPKKRDDPRVADPVLKESALLTNIFNRLARSCFYEAQKNFDGLMPAGEVSPEVVEAAQTALARYEVLMHKVELHNVVAHCDEYLRAANKVWADDIKAADAAGDLEARRKVLRDTCYALRVATLMMHPIVPRGCELICEYLGFAPETFFTWDAPFAGVDELMTAEELAAGGHPMKELPPRFDFFRKHESQY